MKKLLATFAAVLISAATYGQGQLSFDNIVPGFGSGIYMADSNPKVGPGANSFAQVLVTPVGGGAQIALTPPTPFYDVAGFEHVFESRIYTIAGLAPGSQVNYVVQAWKGGASFDESSIKGSFTSTTPYTLGGDTTPPGNLPFAEFALVIPEPSTIALGLIGAAALFLRRRK